MIENLALALWVGAGFFIVALSKNKKGKDEKFSYPCLFTLGGGAIESFTLLCVAFSANECFYIGVIP